MSLAVGTAHPTHWGPRLGILHPLRHHLVTEAVGQGDERGGQGPVEP